MIKLIPVEDIDKAADILYLLLRERTKEQSISHKGMPSFDDHVRFIESNPYFKWFFIVDEFDGVIAGSIYLTKQREIGIAIFNDHQGKGIGSQALEQLMNDYPGKFLANINPKNTQSIEFFNKFGFKHIQNTYQIG